MWRKEGMWKLRALARGKKEEPEITWLFMRAISSSFFSFFLVNEKNWRNIFFPFSRIKKWKRIKGLGVVVGAFSSIWYTICDLRISSNSIASQREDSAQKKRQKPHIYSPNPDQTLPSTLFLLSFASTMDLQLWQTLKEAISSYTGMSPATLFTVLALVFAVYYVISGLFGSHGAYRRPRDYQQQMQPLTPPVQLGEVTEEELKQYDGSDPNKPLLMAIKGQIYDVSQSRYGGSMLRFPILLHWSYYWGLNPVTRITFGADILLG